MSDVDWRGDLGAVLAFDALIERGHERAAVMKAMEKYPGEFWFDFFGPLIDEIGEALGIGAFPDEEQIAAERIARDLRRR